MYKDHSNISLQFIITDSYRHFKFLPTYTIIGVNVNCLSDFSFTT